MLYMTKAMWDGGMCRGGKKGEAGGGARKNRWLILECLAR